MRLKKFFLGFAIVLSTLIGHTEGFGGLKLPKQQFLDPKEAFQVTATREGDTIKANISLGDKIYIYAKDLHFKVTKPIQAGPGLSGLYIANLSNSGSVPGHGRCGSMGLT